ncbi:hypothetical protein [Alkalilimnicola ehrlichii]|uniref:hypothetical protein n=1 Tax=Alkalilimnicola ehrlichii TaxID=351052 RepID=UPI0015F2868F|nr:hypothetical protein [Alkalilimnicola ehrlichii]
MTRFLQTLFIVLGGLLTGAAVLLAWLVFTTAGAQWLAGVATDYEERLALTVENGSLWTGLTVRDLSWRDADIQVAVPSAQVLWNASCLIQRRVCLNAVRVQKAEIDIATSAEDTERDAPEPGEFGLPVAILLHEAVITELRVRVDDVEVHLAEAKLGGSLVRDHLRLTHAHLAGLNVALPEPAVAEATTETAALEAAGPLELPEVRLPLTIEVQEFSLYGGRLLRGGEQWDLRWLAVAGSLDDGRLALDQFRIEHELGRARAFGDVQLSGDYRIDLNLDLEVPDLLEAGPARLALRLRESIPNLALEGELSGAVDARLAGRLQPLQPTLPFEVELLWESLGWPLDDRDLVQADRGSLQVAGSLDHYRLDLNTALDGAQFPAAEVSLLAQGNAEGLLLERLQLLTLDGALVASGRLDWADAFAWDVHLAADELNPGEFWEDFPGQISGRLASVGAVSEAGWRLQVATEGVGGMLRGYPFALRADVGKDEQEHWTVNRLRIANGANLIEVVGRLTDEWELDGRFDLPNLALLMPELGGGGHGRFQLSGALETPSIAFEVGADDFAWNDELSVASARIRGSIEALGEAHSRLQWELRDIVAGDQVIEYVRGQLAGDLSEHELVAAARAYVGLETVETELSVIGALQDEVWRGELRSAAVGPPNQPWELLESVSIQWDGERSELTVARHCWGYRDGRLCMDEDAALTAHAGAVSVSLRGYRLGWLAFWSPPGVHLSGPLEADLRAAGRRGALRKSSFRRIAKAASCCSRKMARPRLSLAIKRLACRPASMPRVWFLA